MNMGITRVAVAVGAAAALSALELTGVSVAGASTGVGQHAGASAAGVSAAAAVPGTQLWVKRYNGPGNGTDEGDAAAVSPGGGTVFVTGVSQGRTSGQDCLTIAYNAATGAQRWVKRYNGPANKNDRAGSVAVSPGGGKVFVTGLSTGAASAADYVTIAYNAATGAQLWVRRYNGPGNGDDRAASVAVSPNGGTVFVTGQSTGAATSSDYATIAYNAATGAQLWVKRYNGPGNYLDSPAKLAISPAGRTVFVTGFSVGEATKSDYATIAYDAATGAQRWVKRYNGPANDNDSAESVAVSPAGGTVFVTGYSFGTSAGRLDGDYATIAYNAATGAQRWVKRYNGPANRGDAAYSVAISPAGGTVFVTGVSYGATSDGDYATVAYNAATGAQRWVKRYNGPGNYLDSPAKLAISRTGRTVYVTGFSSGVTHIEDYATLAYNAATGAQRWVKRYNGPGNGTDVAYSVAVSPTRGTVFVTGQSWGSNATAGDCATIAYSG